MAEPWSPLQHYFPGGSPGTLGIGAARARSSSGGSSPSFTLSGEFWNSSYYNPRTTPLRTHHAWHKPDSKGRHLETLLKGHGTKMQEQMVYEHFQPYLFPNVGGNQKELADLQAAQDKLKADQQALAESQGQFAKDQKRFGEERALWDAQFKRDDQGITYVDVGDPSKHAVTASNVQWNLPSASTNNSTVKGVKTVGANRLTRNQSARQTFNRKGTLRIRNNQLNI